MRNKGMTGDGRPRLQLTAEDRRAHLEFIQAVVTRMAASSSSTKEWLLPVVTATFGFAITMQEVSVAFLGTVAVIIFAILDANYLNQERAFRRLYDAVAAGEDVQPFSMNASLAAPAVSESTDGARQRNQLWAGIRGWIPPIAVWSSWAIAPFYGSFILVGLFIILRALCAV